MDERTAWMNFCATGSVQAYLQYARLRDAHTDTGEENADAISNRWPGDPGDDGGRERPAGNGIDC